MSASSRRIDRLQATFDHGGIVANAGLVVPATLMVRLGLEALIDAWVKTGSSRPGRKVLTLVAAMLAGATHIDHVNVLRAGATQRVLPFKVMAPSTIGSFLRSFTFGHVRHIPSGHYHANAAWLACAVLAHNLGCWSTQLAGQPPVTNRTRRTRLIAVPAVIVNRSGRTLLRFPARWPWARAFNTVLNALRALPAPSG